jgi:hypothetical protein
MDIEGYENYLIYPNGDVYRKKKQKRSTEFFMKTRVLNNYVSVGLYKHLSSKQTNFRVHRLVAQHYIQNPHNKPQVDHIDGNKLNNDVSNLRWMSPLENMNSFQPLLISNTSGFRGISKCENRWRYCKRVMGTRHTKFFKTKKEAICYKFIFILMIKANKK